MRPRWIIGAILGLFVLGLAGCQWASVKEAYRYHGADATAVGEGHYRATGPTIRKTFLYQGRLYLLVQDGDGFHAVPYRAGWEVQ